MRIAIYSSSFPVISETFVINQIIGLIKLGVKVDILTNNLVNHEVMHDSVKEYTLLEHVKCFGAYSNESKFTQVYLTIINAAKLIFKGSFLKLISILCDQHLLKKQKIGLIYWLSKNEEKDLNYSNIICHFGDQGYYVCKLRDLGLISGPVSTVFHAQEMSKYKVIEKNIFAYKKLFIKGELMLPISELWRKQLIDWGCDSSKIKVHRMGIDPNYFLMENTKRKLSSPLKVIQVGRLTEKKAILDSINAVVIASQKIPIDFTIIGDGELFNEARTLILSLGASQYIHLLGRLPQDIVKQKLKISDVFLLPSVRAKDGDMEGIPVALMEAMALGLITLSTYHSGICELIENTISGFLVAETQVEDIANTLVKIDSLSEVDIEKVRIKARHQCLKKFNNEILNREITELLIKK